MPTAKEEPTFHFTYPVIVGDGRTLIISWNREDNASHVALRFAEEHGIMPDEIPTIEAFVQQATVESTAVGQSNDAEDTNKSAFDNQVAMPQKETDEPKETHSEGNEEFKECDSKSKQSDEDAEGELLQTASHLAEAGLGHVDVLLELLKMHDGSVKRTLEVLGSYD